MFLSEKELVNRLIEHYDKYFTVQEIGAGYGISDLLIIRNKTELIRFMETRNGTYLKHLDDIRVFEYIRKRNGVTLDEMMAKLYISKSKLRYSIVKRLEEIGAVIKKENFYYRGSNFKLFCPNVTAFEAKLEDWKKGLAQAIRYQRFADKSYLALDEKFVHRANQEEFLKYNIGLISVGPKVKEIIKPISQRPLDPIMRYKVAEETISKIHFTCEKLHLT